MSRKHAVRVGVLTLALTLIGLGAVWLAQNLTGVSYFSHLTRWWPVLLILLGAEYLLRHGRYDSEVPVRWSVGSLILIFLICGGLATAAWVPAVPLQQVRDLVVEEIQVEEPYHFDLDPIQDIPGRTVRIENTAGQVQVRGSSDGMVHVSGTMGYIRQNLETGGGVPGQVRAVPGDSLRVTAENNEGFKLRYVNYEVQLPPGINLEVKNGSGRVRVTGVDGSLGIENQNGEVTASEIRGKVAVRNSNGNVHLQNVTGDAALRTELGMIDINGFQGSLLAESNQGTINVRTDKPVTENWDLKTSMGSIEARIPEDSSVVLEASTQSGSINGSSRLNWQSQNGKKVSRLGDGQGTIRMSVHRGSINVNVAD
ncbi:MAG: DUF4097 family beta strand repeat protein [Firmicutes bacterium]|nr:DUF4097 family beta strand repeat protein [Bacillota bacterium]